MRNQGYRFCISFCIIASLATLCLNLPVEFSIASNDTDEFLSEERVIELFQQWKEEQGKVYRDFQEAEKRFQNFHRNLRYIMEKNSQRYFSSGHILGLIKLADISNEEFKKVYSIKLKKPIGTARRGNTLRTFCETPASLDWRKRGAVIPVKDQGNCGSCWAFSSTGAMEGINEIVTGDLISLSEQELVDCDTTNEGCDGGIMYHAFGWVISKGGIDTEADYPYTGVDGICNTTKGIYNGDIDHAVLIVGYGSEGDEGYWIVKNSWGTSWGINGYIYIKRNTGLPYGFRAINAMASYPTKQYSCPSPLPCPIAAPSPPPPPPSDCRDYAYCLGDETCCCIFFWINEEPRQQSPITDKCFMYGCCQYENAVCCSDSAYCCPSDYPICDIEEGLCLRRQGDYVGMAVKKLRIRIVELTLP